MDCQIKKAENETYRHFWTIAFADTNVIDWLEIVEMKRIQPQTPEGRLLSNSTGRKDFQHPGLCN